jgi:beta-glucanase (GH16 family)
MMGAIHSASRRRAATVAALHTYDWSAGTATGSETVTRSGTATYINSSGNRVSAAVNTPRIEYSGETQNTVLGIMIEPTAINRILQSANLSTGWGTTNLTVGTAAGTGMGGSNTLFSLTQTAAGGQFSRTATVPASSTITATWYMKAGTGRYVFLTFHDDPGYTSQAHAFFDLQTGLPTTTTNISGTGFSNIVRSGRKLANGIVEMKMTVTAGSGVTAVLVQCNIAGGDNVWSGTSGQIRYFDSVQVETTATPTSYISTTTTTDTRGAETVTVPMTNRTYDILVMDATGGEWRDGVVVSGGVYTVTPKTGKRHVLRVAAYPNGALTTTQKEALAVPTPYPYTSGMVLVWRDEFTDPDLSRFSDSGTVTSSGTGKPWRTRFTHGSGGFSSATINSESQVYTNSGPGGYLGLNPFSISNSILRITADEIPAGTANIPTNTFYEPDAPYKFYSGMLSSDPLKTFTYGLFEIRSKSDAIPGTWPAFWLIRLLGETHGGEIDIFENIGDQPTKTHQTWHYHYEPDKFAIGGPYTYPSGGTIDQWHTYAVLWEPGRVVWYVDGVQTREVLQSEIDGKAMMLIVNLALNTTRWQVSSAQSVIDDQTGVWDPDPADLPTYLDVDYIRVYQTSGTPDNS